MILPDSRLSRFLTGRIRAVIHSCVFVAVSVPILAWQALSASDLVALLLVVLCLAASTMALGDGFNVISITRIVPGMVPTSEH